MVHKRILALHGEKDFSLGNQLDEEFGAMSEFGANEHVILDLSDVPFADAAFLTALLRASGTIDQRRRKRVSIVSGRASIVARLFKITHLDQVFRMFDDISSACAVGTGCDPITVDDSRSASA